MKSTVVGSFPVELKEPSSTKDKLLKAFGAHDIYKDAIKTSVIAQLDAGVDIISDGQVRGDMVSIFTRYIPGMKIEEGNTMIVSKIRNPTQEISVKDLQYAKKVMKDYYNGNIPEGKGIKGIITGPNTIIHSSRILGFYKNKEDIIFLFDFMLYFYYDILNLKISREIIYMNNYMDDLSEISSNNTIEKIQKKMQIIENIKIKLDSNMNSKLLLDNFIINFSEV